MRKLKFVKLFENFYDPNKGRGVKDFNILVGKTLMSGEFIDTRMGPLGGYIGGLILKTDDGDYNFRVQKPFTLKIKDREVLEPVYHKRNFTKNAIDPNAKITSATPLQTGLGSSQMIYGVEIEFSNGASMTIEGYHEKGIRPPIKFWES
jgi:hypothetical protein